MAFQSSPGVVSNEVDLTGIVPGASTTEGALAGVFRWGPIGVVQLLESETDMASRVGPPTNHNPETWFVGANFLAYGSALNLSRAANTSGVIIASNGMSFSATPVVSLTTTNATAAVVVSNSAGLAAGMKIITSDSANVIVGATISSITNSTSIVLSSASFVVGTGAASVQFIANNIVLSAVANVSGQVANLSNQIVLNNDDYYRKDISDLNNVTAGRAFDSNVLYVARFPGEVGNSLRISVCDSSVGHSASLNLASYGNGGANVSINVGSNSATVTIAYVHAMSNSAAQTAVESSASSLKGSLQVTDLLQFGNASAGYQSLKISSIGNTSSSVNTTYASATFALSFDDELRLIENQVANTTITRYWEFYDLMDTPPGQSTYMANFGNTSANDELHVVVVDEDGLFSGTPGAVLEKYQGVSRATDGKSLDGSTNYYKDVINTKSQYVWFARDRSTAVSNTAPNLASATNTSILSVNFNYGSDGSDEGSVSLSVLSNAYDLFRSAEDIDISLVMAGKARGGTAGGQMANYLIDNIGEARKDCVIYISPDKNDVVNNRNNEVADMVVFRNTLRSTSYGFLDGNYKYQYDRYNDLYRWVPLNGDTAGLSARTDLTNDAWWSPAGFNRGQIKNIVRLAFNPRLAQRDVLYKNGINPIVSFPGDGTILYGDKTLLAKPSAFDRINVRRLFIVLRKTISRAAKYQLFEFNDEFTRSQFKNMVIPFLRDVKGRRGIYEFKVVCDSTNNPGSVIDRNEFVGDIYIKPARVINFINLNFVAVNTDVNFSEIIGKF